MSQKIRQYEMQRRRGLIIYLLYISRPKALEFSSIIYLLDARNYPLTRRRLAEDLDFLRDAGLLRITCPSADIHSTDALQEKQLHQFAESDGDLDNEFCARLINKGLNFQEGYLDESGIMRVS